MARYGWRAYALPILSAVTVAALVQGAPSTAATSPSPQAGHAQASGGRATGAGAVQVEGSTSGSNSFQAGSTPKPVVVHLGDDAVSCATNAYRQLVLVSITQQHLWACSGHQQVASTPVTTGRTTGNDQTPLGSWRVQSRERDRYLVGAGYRDYVHFWLPFNGDFGLHDSPWQTMAYGSQDYTANGSHGCVHVPATTMKWLYGWSTVDDTVVTVET